MLRFGNEQIQKNQCSLNLKENIRNEKQFSTHNFHLGKYVLPLIQIDHISKENHMNQPPSDSLSSCYWELRSTQGWRYWWYLIIEIGTFNRKMLIQIEKVKKKERVQECVYYNQHALCSIRIASTVLRLPLARLVCLPEYYRQLLIYNSYLYKLWNKQVWATTRS